MLSYIKDQWLSTPLKKRPDAFSVVIIPVMGLSIIFNMLVMNFPLENSNVVFSDNSLCYDVQKSMEQEVEASELYVGEQTWENAKQYRLACSKTENSIDALFFNYDVIGPERYARTWSIKNGCEGYQIFRDQVPRMGQPEGGSVERLCRIYGMQGYLQTYARRLTQSILREGERSYWERVPLLYDLPYMIMACSVLMTITVICLTKFLSDTLIVPMVKLIHSSREIVRNDSGGEGLVVENRDETGELVQTSNETKYVTGGHINALKRRSEVAERLHKEEVKRVKMEKRLDVVRLGLLESQINPYFLSNTLNMISCIAKLEEAQTTEQTISSPGNLFCYNPKTSEQIVPLDQELKVMQDYTCIRQTRFGNRVSHSFRVEVDGSEITIPAFTFQPLVENAVIHDIVRKEEGRRVFLRIWRQKDKLVISLVDTEVGMDEETLKWPMDALKGHRTARVDIGSGNIYQRIKSTYEDGGSRTYSGAGKGTVVQTILPAIREEGYQKT